MSLESDFKRLRADESWVGQARQTQESLRERVILQSFQGLPEFVGGADLSFGRFSTRAFAGIVVLKLPELEVVEQSGVEMELKLPYVPGYLSFREIPPLLEAWKQLKKKPEVLIVDGHGRAHPRHMGIATHLGVILDCPTIGCGKSRLVGQFEEPGLKQGSFAPLIFQGEEVGVVLRTKKAVKPVFVSPGQYMDVPSAYRIVKACMGRYRLPEATRQAHLYVNEIRKAAGFNKTSSESESLT